MKLSAKSKSMRTTEYIRLALRALCCITAVLICSCVPKKDDRLSSSDRTYKVAVLMHKSEQARWERTADFALGNIARAQRGMDNKIQLQLCFKDQDAPDIDDYMQQIARDTTIIAIIGPTTSIRAEQMALQLTRMPEYHKPLLTPSATYVQYQRKFANIPYIWNLAESDITQLEIIISEIASLHTDGQVTLELLAQDDGRNDVTSDYVQWFSFIAEEYSLQVSGVHLYSNTDDIRRCVEEICGTDPEKQSRILLFSPTTEDDAIAFDRELCSYQAQTEAQGKQFFAPFRIYCSDGFVSERIADAVQYDGYEGVDLSATPESGFIQAYQKIFGSEPLNGEAQFFDAINIIAYAATLYNSPLRNRLTSFNDAIQAVVSGEGGNGGTWFPFDMARHITLLRQGVTPHIEGVSSVTNSTFRRWRLFEGQYVTTEYISSQGSKRTTSSKNIGEWFATKIDDLSLSDSTSIPRYPTLDKNWALIIAASKGWPNYRFQADALAMYQILKYYGFDDDHIVLVCEDDLANHTYNPLPGQLFVTLNGRNVYDQSAIDYRLHDLKPVDIGDILQGRASERLPHVLEPDNDDNVFIFWSSHGSPGSLYFGDSPLMTYSKMKDILSDTPHRKMLFVVEACYSGGLGQACQGIPGTLFVTAATPYETSHADVWSEEIGVYLSNGFTQGFMNAIYKDPAVSLRDLYYTLAAHTNGSHVKIYNNQKFGSVYNNTMQEFIKP